MASMALPPFKASALSMTAKGVNDNCHMKKPGTNISDKTLLITGSNSGIGLACARMLPEFGITHLIMVELDMLSYPLISTFAKNCKTLLKLNIAILNASVSSGNVNYLSTALLFILLLLILASSLKHDPGYLNIVGSGTAFFADFNNCNADPLLPSFDVPFNGLGAGAERYSVSKLLICVMVYMLLLSVPVDKVIINAVESGLTSGTSLHRGFKGAGKYFMAVMKKLIARTLEEVAWTYFDAVVVHGKESHGGIVMFWEVCGFPPILYDDDGRRAMEKLWKETMGELKFFGVKEMLESMRV
ncbi:hypothetical protein BU23DRAFT_581157 [Bimuria novae-zelandiae CBS 107.79]|uniref:NAD(P)-binding protein n=1 Tax=Bimuria novae-zelandiae CBS 107.79 TaxID=1447943 RepID=A0A6A5V6K7_9PLEO|nr:hypothetical protein BU23DRAFT_581157 [Bimuria novae-zelandiae CBS 107.79]